MDYSELDKIYDGMSEENLDEDIATKLMPYIFAHKAEFDPQNIPEKHNYLASVLNDISEVDEDSADPDADYEFSYSYDTAEDEANDHSEPTDITSVGKTKENLEANDEATKGVVSDCTMKNIIGSLIGRI